VTGSLPLGDILQLGRELRNVEFKRSGSASDKHFFAVVARAMMALANIRDGGTIVVGVPDAAGELPVGGVEAEHQPSWNQDHVADRLSTYAQPSVSFTVEVQGHGGKQFVVISVDEFDEVPILCVRDFERVLRRGGCYVRSRRKPESVEVATQEDMRELLDLAVEKRLRRFLRTAQAADMTVRGPTDADQFEQQIGDLRE